jgi:hypothetical protein
MLLVWTLQSIHLTIELFCALNSFIIKIDLIDICSIMLSLLCLLHFHLHMAKLLVVL